MKQSGSRITTDNLQEFLDSATNAAELGQRQFFTPEKLAAALFLPLTRHHNLLCTDLNFGSGNLATAAGAKDALGLDIDARVTRGLTAPEGSAWRTAQADVTHWYPLAEEAGLKLPFITVNPPFSLKWHSDRLAALRDSDLPEVAETAAAHPKTIDSTLATLLIALDRLHQLGEGFMVCNAATARRFLGHPTDDPDRAAPHAALRSYLWLWLEIPNVNYEGVATDFDTAVLYFSPSHGFHADEGTEPLALTAPGSTPQQVTETLSAALLSGQHPHQGRRFQYEHEIHPPSVIGRWDAVVDEYRTRHGRRKPAWNIRLDAAGKLHTHLTPFQSTSRYLDQRLVQKLHLLHGHTPISLCVTATSRTALREAAECGVWRIHPEVPAAIDKALNDYASEGAPFYRPNSIQSLGWIDEHSTLRCIASGVPGCEVGKCYPIETALEQTRWESEKINLAGETEKLGYTGKELVVTIRTDDGPEHRFHVRRDDSLAEEEVSPAGELQVKHWHIADLIAHFEIPPVQDITDLRPDEYHHHLAELDRIEQAINANIQAA